MAAPSTTLPHAHLVARSYDLPPSDAVWIATALLHYEHPDRQSFPSDGIVSSVLQHGLTHATRTVVADFVDRLAVSNRKPEVETERVSMLFALPDGTRRVFQTLDSVERERWGAAGHPAWETLPQEFYYLRDWYERWDQASIDASPDPLLRLVGSWTYGGADEYVASLRQGWDQRP